MFQIFWLSIVFAASLAAAQVCIGFACIGTPPPPPSPGAVECIPGVGLVCVVISSPPPSNGFWKQHGDSVGGGFISVIVLIIVWICRRVIKKHMTKFCSWLSEAMHDDLDAGDVEEGDVETPEIMDTDTNTATALEEPNPAQVIPPLPIEPRAPSRALLCNCGREYNFCIRYYCPSCGAGGSSYRHVGGALM